MNVELMIQAKADLYVLNAQYQLVFGVVATVVAVSLAIFRRFARMSDLTDFVTGLVLVVGAMFGPLLILHGVYLLNTSDLRARTDLANYNLIELKK